MDGTVRQATAKDYEAVVAFTEDTWADREVADYIPDVFHDWVDSDGPDQRTFVFEVGADIAGLCQGVMLSDHEAWAQGMRTNPAYRGQGVGPALTEAVFEWAREQGATVCRNLVFSWNAAGLGLSRAAGFEPVMQFRFVHPDPDDEAEAAGDHSVIEDAGAVWSHWHRSAAVTELRGLALDPAETWALSELTRETVMELADDERVFAVQGQEGTRAAAMRVRDFESTDGTHYAEYGFATWTNLAGAKAITAAIKRDAATLGAEQTRVVIPETVRYVSDGAAARANIGESPEFVLEKALR